LLVWNTVNRTLAEHFISSLGHTPPPLYSRSVPVMAFIQLYGTLGYKIINKSAWIVGVGQGQ